MVEGLGKYIWRGIFGGDKVGAETNKQRWDEMTTRESFWYQEKKSQRHSHKKSTHFIAEFYNLPLDGLINKETWCGILKSIKKKICSLKNHGFEVLLGPENLNCNSSLFQ